MERQELILSIKRKAQYHKLLRVLNEAYIQASVGKGKERHATSEAFEKQHMVRGGQLFGVGGPLFQAHKKIEECVRLDKASRRRELLGAIVYIAGAIISEEGE